MKEGKSEKTWIKYLAEQGFAGSVLALDDGSESRPLWDRIPSEEEPWS